MALRVFFILIVFLTVFCAWVPNSKPIASILPSAIALLYSLKASPFNFKDSFSARASPINLIFKLSATFLIPQKVEGHQQERYQ